MRYYLRGIWGYEWLHPRPTFCPELDRRAGSLHSIPVHSKDVCLNFRQLRKASCVFVNTTRSFAQGAEEHIGCVIPQALYPADRTARSSHARLRQG
jgi:hypothetical protein